MRDEFDKKTSEILAKRVGFRCSNPDCRRLTSGPRSDPSLAVNVGVAAHITAASPGGPRFDPALTAKQRRSAKNGIWLCQTHAKLVDNDPLLYTAELLQKWKKDAEERAAREIQGHGLPAHEAAPIFMVPVTRNPYFTGREDVLHELAATLAAQGAVALGQAEATQLPELARAAISGLGGIGKTQIAIEYAYHHRDAYRAVFFVRADTESELVSGYVAIAREIGLPEAAEQDQGAAVAAVQRWLGTNDGWLLILDNADEPKIVKPFLPAHTHGHVLVTSRAPSFAVLGIGEPLRIGTLSPAEALDFLLARLARRDAAEPERQSAAMLATELGYLPLALEQAGAYLVEHQDTFGDYLESYRRRGLELLARGVPEVDGHPDPVTTTWSLNFQQVEALSPAAADVLRASAFLAPDEIPEELLIDGGAELGSAIAVTVAGGDSLVVGELLAPLLRYSLVRRDSTNRTWSVHRMVQEVVKWNLGDARSGWTERIVKAFSGVFPWPEFATWSRCERLLPHLLIAARQAAASPELAWLLNVGGKYLVDRARYGEAESFFIRQLDILEIAIGKENPIFATALNNLATLYCELGRLADSELRHSLALAIREKVLGKNHPEVAQSLNNLANLYTTVGRLEEAEPLLARSLLIYEQTLGEEHPLVTNPLNNLAILYRKQGRLDKAELLYARALAIRVKALGKDDPEVAQSLFNLALLYIVKGQLVEAEPLLIDALEILENALGEFHPRFTHVLNNLAILYVEQGQLEKAESLFTRSFDIFVKSSGKANPDVVRFLDNLAILYREKGRLEEAEKFETLAHLIRQQSSRTESAPTQQ